MDPTTFVLVFVCCLETCVERNRPLEPSWPNMLALQCRMESRSLTQDDLWLSECVSCLIELQPLCSLILLRKLACSTAESLQKTLRVVTFCDIIVFIILVVLPSLDCLELKYRNYIFTNFCIITYIFLSQVWWVEEIMSYSSFLAKYTYTSNLFLKDVDYEPNKNKRSWSSWAQWITRKLFPTGAL